MSAHAKNHHNQKRRNTAKGMANSPMLRMVAERVQRQDDEEMWQSMDEIIKSREAKFLNRKYSE